VLLGKVDAPSDSSHDEACRHGVCQDRSAVWHEALKAAHAQVLRVHLIGQV
jgi:hypothetical protein